MVKHKYLGELCFMLLILFSLYNSCDCCPPYQKDALLHFKSLFLGNNSSVLDPNGVLDSWNSTTDCCEWDCVECNSDSNPHQVTDLILSFLLPEDHEIFATSDVLVPLFHLQTLENLEFYSNSIRGSIPSEIGNLTKLRSLALTGDGFSGSIPSSLFNLKELVKLDLSYNSLEGSIPPEIGNLTKLQQLYLSWNGMIGSIPVGMRSLSNLTTLDLSHNKLWGRIPAHIGNLTKLSSLDLGDNNLSNELPPSIGNLVNLSELYLNKNNLTGEIPASIKQLTTVRFLVLADNSFTGDFPTWLLNFSSAIKIDVGGNNFHWKNSTTTFPVGLGLMWLSLRSCNITWEIAISLSNLTELLFLDLSDNNLKGPIPQWPFDLLIEVLNLSDNMLTSPLPSDLFLTQTLEAVFLSRNNFTGELPNVISENSALKELVLSENYLVAIETNKNKLPFSEFSYL